MPKATEKSACEKHTFSNEESEIPSSSEELTSSEHGPDPKVSFEQFKPHQPVPGMFMPYIEGPKMEWTVDDGFYHRFLKRHLKCRNILECELAALSEQQQCKKVIVWSGDIGMDQCLMGSVCRRA